MVDTLRSKINLTNMALWQIRFFVVPQRKIADVEIKYDEDGTFDDSIFWEDLKIKSDFFFAVSQILPQAKSWSSSIILFGDENSHRFEVGLFNGYVNWALFQIDFTKEYDSTLTRFIEFCKETGLILLNDKLNVLPLNVESVKKSIEDSDQIRIYNILSKSAEPG